MESKAASPGQNGGENVGYHRNSTACDVKHVGEEWELGMRILLIEDDSATAQSIELMLKSAGFNVYTTDLGEEGIDLGKVYDYDIILLDLNLPDVSGFEVLRSLRSLQGEDANPDTVWLSRHRGQGQGARLRRR